VTADTPSRQAPPLKLPSRRHKSSWCIRLSDLPNKTAIHEQCIQYCEGQKQAGENALARIVLYSSHWAFWHVPLTANTFPDSKFVRSALLNRAADLCEQYVRAYLRSVR
jgi:hypothetical protein